MAKYWFPAKRYGWGWGLPGCWQGWAIMIGWIAMVTIGAVLFVGGPWFVPFMIVMAAWIIVVCWITGEPPRWRWGGD